VCCQNSAPKHVAYLRSRIPVKARQYTRTWAIFQSISGQESPTSAYSYGIDTSVFDDPNKDGHEPTLVLHENAHTIDYAWPYIHGGSGRISGTDFSRCNLVCAYLSVGLATTDWVNAINADACVPDSYAKSSTFDFSFSV
jgi:hypothetical protein